MLHFIIIFTCHHADVLQLFHYMRCSCIFIIIIALLLCHAPWLIVRRCSFDVVRWNKK